MAGTASEEFGVGRSLEEISQAQQQAISEWRGTQHLEIESPSTSPPYWDSDDEDDNGPKPAELYGKYTWKIDKFSQINKRELRSNPFEIGGYKWYILIYPQGCDVCNHLSLFLCVANHDKLLPGWSHFAQFTIAVVNKDPKKSKYSDTLHRFWKKEHDWGWKKFMELSKVLDGFIEGDQLIIKAQVQVIRERADRPFRCLDCNYRRELIRVYLTNVEQICRRFVEERRGKLGKLIEDKGRWTSFCTFWLGMDQTSRRAMSWEKTDSILKVIAKHFFIEKEVTSTLVMDSLYSGMKALEGQSSDKSKGKQHVDIEESPTAPIVRMEKDMFVLVDDVLLLLERAALEPLPPKDEKGPQNRTKEGSTGDEFNKDSIERDERRLTELGRRTIEIFVLAHIFSKIEVAYQEAVALKRQEELIREEEAAWLAESEQKTRRGADKEKKSKKKQAKQKRNNRKTKDKSKDEKPVIVPVEHEIPKNFLSEEPEGSTEKVDVAEDVSDVSDSVDCIPEVQHHHPNAGDTDLVVAGDWDNTETPDDLQPTVEASSPLAVSNGPVGEMSAAASAVDDSSSTCSTDSIPSVVVNGINKGKRTPSSYFKKQKSPNRRHERGKSMEADWSGGGYHNQPSESPVSTLGSYKKADINTKGALCLPEENQTKGSNQPELKKVEETASSGTVLGIKVEKEAERLSVEMTLTLPTKNSSSLPELKAERKTGSNSGKSASVGRLSDIEKTVDESSQVRHPVEVTVMSKSGTCKPTSADLPEKPSMPQQHVPVSAGRPVSHQVPEPSTQQHVPVSAGKPVSHQVPEPSTQQHVPVSAGKPVSHQVPEPSTQQHVPVSAGKPVSHQVPEPSMQQHVPVSAGKPMSHQAPVFTEKPFAQTVPVSAEKVSTQKVAVVSRPLTSNLVPGSSRPTTLTPGISMVQAQPPLLSRSSSSAGWSNPETSSTATSSYSYVPQSYRNVMMGSVGFAQSSHQMSHSPALVSKPLFTTSQSPERVEVNAIKSSFSPFGMVKQDNNMMMPPDGRHWIETTTPQIEDDHLSSNGLRNIDIYKQMQQQQQQQHSIPHYLLPPEYAAVGTSGRVNLGLGDEFPHMGIINDLLEDDASGRTGVMGSSFHTYSNGGQHFHRQFSLPTDTGGGLSTDIGPSTSSSCRFERTLSYHDGLHHHAYASPYETLRDMAAAPPPQPSYRPYAANGHHHMDMLPNQWQMGGGGGGGGGGNERPYLNTRDMNNDGFPPYHHNHAEYINLASSCGRINFSGFHPSSNGN